MSITFSNFLKVCGINDSIRCKKTKRSQRWCLLAQPFSLKILVLLLKSSKKNFTTLLLAKDQRILGKMIEERINHL